MRNSTGYDRTKGSKRSQQIETPQAPQNRGNSGRKMNYTSRKTRIKKKTHQRQYMSFLEYAIGLSVRKLIKKGEVNE